MRTRHHLPVVASTKPARINKPAAIRPAITTYAKIVNGDYFFVKSGSGDNVAFLQTDDDTHFKEFCVESLGWIAPGHRRRPTRLSDGAFHGLGDLTPVEITTREAAIACAGACRKI